jgi:hypothetical protein
VQCRPPSFTGNASLSDRFECQDGSEGAELAADDGGWADASYSTVAQVIAHCASLGLTGDDWPVFYGIDPGRADLAEIARRCERLRSVIVGIDAPEGPRLLSSIREWLAAGEVFAVFE